VRRTCKSAQRAFMSDFLTGLAFVAMIVTPAIVATLQFDKSDKHNA